MGLEFSQDQILTAQNADTISFLGIYMGFTFKQTGNYYRCKEHDSLVVCPDRKGFVWNSRDIKGGDAIDFLIKVCDMSFVEAVSTILRSDCDFVQVQVKNLGFASRVDFVLPRPVSKNRYLYKQVYAYLCRTRHIDTAVVTDFMKLGKIYQDNKKNCVFVGFDEEGNPKFAALRSTVSAYGFRYRGEVKGSDKKYSFNQIGNELTTVYVFESPIDLLSHCTIANIRANNNKEAYKEQTRLSLCGTSDVALEAFLKRHNDTKKIKFCLDNDAAGHEAVNKYVEKYQKLGYIVESVFSKSKDINDDLCKFIEQKKKTKGET